MILFSGLASYAEAYERVHGKRLTWDEIRRGSQRIVDENGEERDIVGILQQLYG